jgi:hypothetical protein
VSRVVEDIFERTSPSDVRARTEVITKTMQAKDSGCN